MCDNSTSVGEYTLHDYFEELALKAENSDVGLKVNNDFGEANELSDVTLVVGYRKIPAVKAILSTASPVFRAMFRADFQESAEREVNIPEKSYEDFVEFLCCIYPDKIKEITAQNVYQLLPLASEYQVHEMKRRCHLILLDIVKEKHSDCVMELYRHLRLSQTYDLTDLQNICIALASEHKHQQLKAAQQRYRVSEESHQEIIELALKKRELGFDDFNFLNFSESSMSRTYPYGKKCLDKNYFVSVKFTGKLSINSVENSLQAARLMSKYNLGKHDKKEQIKSDIQKYLRKMTIGERRKYRTEIGLLPDEYKKDLV